MSYTNLVAPIIIQTSVDSLPSSCESYTPGFTDKEIQLRIIRATLSDAVNEKAWIQGQLGDEPCPSEEDYNELISQALDLQFEETTKQAPLLRDLYQFKEISDDNGSTEIMKQRMFDSLFMASNPLPTRPLSPAIEVPEIPFYCPPMASSVSQLE